MIFYHIHICYPAYRHFFGRQSMGRRLIGRVNENKHGKHIDI